jgi:hypothetical protein
MPLLTPKVIMYTVGPPRYKYTLCTSSTLSLYSLTIILCLLHLQHLQVGCISLISCTLMAAQQVMGPVSLAPSMAAFERLATLIPDGSIVAPSGADYARPVFLSCSRQTLMMLLALYFHRSQCQTTYLNLSPSLTVPTMESGPVR